MDGKERELRKSLRWTALQSNRFSNTADHAGGLEERLQACQTKQGIYVKDGPTEGKQAQFEAAAWLMGVYAMCL